VQQEPADAGADAGADAAGKSGGCSFRGAGGRQRGGAFAALLVGFAALRLFRQRAASSGGGATPRTPRAAK